MTLRQMPHRLAPAVAAVAAVLAALCLAPPAALADDFDRIAEKGEIRLGYRIDAPPFSFSDDAGRPAGYSVELCARVARAIADAQSRKVEPRFVATSSERRFADLGADKFDILCGATTVTLERRAQFDFSLLTFVTGGTLLVRSEDLEAANRGRGFGKALGVLRGTTSEAAVRRLAKSGVLHAGIVTVATHDEGLARLRKKDFDGYFGDRILLLGLKLGSADPKEFALSGHLFTHEPYALAMRGGERRLQLAVDRALAGLYRSGEIAQVVDNWMPGAEVAGLLEALYILQALPE